MISPSLIGTGQDQKIRLLYSYRSSPLDLLFHSVNEEKEKKKLDYVNRCHNVAPGANYKLASVLIVSPWVGSQYSFQGSQSLIEFEHLLPWLL